MSTTTQSDGDDEADAWEQLEGERDLFEEIVEEDGPFAPHAENLLVALDERQEGDDA